MLEKYFILPTTIDRIRGSWLADPIELYVTWLAERRCSTRTIARRVPLLIRFGDHAQRRGASHVRDLSDHIDAFVRRELRRRVQPCKSQKARRRFVSDLRLPIQQMIRVVLPSPTTMERQPLADWAPGFFVHLRQERGLAEVTIKLYRCYLSYFEKYVSRRGVKQPDALVPAILDGFLADQRQRLRSQSLGPVCAALRALLRFMFREDCMRRDLSGAVERPRTYRLSGIPRAIEWSDVLRTLEGIDRRSEIGKRDYAMMMLLAVYGLRGREVAELTLDDFQWCAGTLHIRARKAGNSTTYPLSSQVIDAVADYLKQGRPETDDRHVFLLCRAPRGPIDHHVVSKRARHHLLAAGIHAPRLGSHTLRHSVAKRLVDAGFSLEVIGAYLGHRSPSSTKIYAKVSVEALREVAIGDGEEIL